MKEETMIDDNKNPADRAYDEMIAKPRAQPTPKSEANQLAKDPPVHCHDSDAFEEMYEDWLEQ